MDFRASSWSVGVSFSEGTGWWLGAALPAGASWVLRGFVKKQVFRKDLDMSIKTYPLPDMVSDIGDYPQRPLIMQNSPSSFSASSCLPKTLIT